MNVNELEKTQEAYSQVLKKIRIVQLSIKELQEEEADLYDNLRACKEAADKMLFPPESAPPRTSTYRI